MAESDAYATAAEYRAHVKKVDDGADATILEQLKGAARLLEQETGRFFTKDDADVSRIFDTDGGDRLYITDLAAAPTTVKVDLNVAYDFTSAQVLTSPAHYFLGPPNALLGPEPAPYTWIRLRGDNGVLTHWPEQHRAVQITGLFGWPAIPLAVKEATIQIVREMRDAQEAGYSLTLESIDNSVPQGREISKIVRRVKVAYGRGVPFA
jgi:hypothetical protein